jgi:hypothetical protein
MLQLKYIIRYTCFFTFFLLFAYQATGFSGKYPIQNFTPVDYRAGIQNIAFAQNRDMGLFVANNLCVLSFNGNAWSSHHRNTGKKNRSLAFDETTNRLYVGSQSDFGYFEQNWEYVSLRPKVPEAYKSFDEVWDVFLRNGNVYFCTFQGLYVFDGQTIQVITEEGGLDRSFVANGNLYTQSQNGNFFEVDGLALNPVFLKEKLDQVIAGRGFV